MHFKKRISWDGKLIKAKLLILENILFLLNATEGSGFQAVSPNQKTITSKNIWAEIISLYHHLLFLPSQEKQSDSGYNLGQREYRRLKRF